jgi:hypothetical protein
VEAIYQTMEMPIGRSVMILRTVILKEVFTGSIAMMGMPIRYLKVTFFKHVKRIETDHKEIFSFLS